MATFSISSSKSLGYTLTLTIEETSQSIAENKTNLSWALKLYSTGYSFSGFAVGYHVEIGSYVYDYPRSSAQQISLPANSVVTLGSGTTSVTHDANGDASVAVSAYDDLSKYRADGTQITAGKQTLSSTITLTHIDRISQITTMPTLNIGTSVTFNITRYISGATHTLAYAFDGLSGNIGTGIATQKSWTIPSTWLARLPNATAKEGTITLSTHSGTDLIGSVTYDVVFRVPANIIPTISATVSPYNTNAYLASKNALVAGFSAVDVDITATAGTGSSIASYSIAGALTYTGTSASYRSGILTAGAKEIVVTAIDARGRTASVTKTFTVLAYSAPSISSLNVTRGTYDGTWTEDEGGAHLKVDVVATIANVADNACTITVSCAGENKTINGTSGTVYYTTTSADLTYEVFASASDSVGQTSPSVTVAVSTADVPLSWNEDRIGIGKVAQTSHALEVAYTASFENDVSFTEIPTAPTAPSGTNDEQLATTAFVENAKPVDFVTEQGTAGTIWTYRKWKSGIAECWGNNVRNETGTAWGNVTEFQGQTYSYPTDLFVAEPVLTVSVASNPSTIARPYQLGSATTTPQIGAFRPDTSYRGATVTIHYSMYAIGRWK